MKLRSVILLLSGIFIFSSCASSYKPIIPQYVLYQSRTEDKALRFDYKYSLLASRYAKKETKKGIKLIAVRMKNTSGKDLIFGKDIKLINADNKEVIVLDNRQAYNELKQGSIGYLLYLLLSPANIKMTSDNQKTSFTPAGIIIGPGLAAINIVAAQTANKKFKEDLLKYNLLGATVKNGEITYGLIGLKSDNFDALTVKVE